VASHSEQREAAVFYADISGFTALSEKLDPEDVTSVMNRVFEILEAIVIARGGMVNKYIGDCVMGLFGLTPADGHPSVQAVRAAVEIRSALYRFNEEGGIPVKLDIHIGVAGGPVIAGMMGGVRQEFTVMGDTVTLAARLEDASDKGQIFVGPQIRADTEAEFEYKPVEPIRLRERDEPIPIYELVAAKQRGRRVKRDSERRQATVVFADLHGFKALAEHLRPVALTDLLNRCFVDMEAIVRNHGGVVDKYIGETLMALFGVPNAIENAPQQAVNAAIEIRNHIAQLTHAASLPVELEVHAGVNTGLVIAGDIGGRVKRDFTVMGDTVNLASRLKEAAPLGAIYVGPETHRYTKETFDYEPIEPLKLKGKAEPVPAYAVRSTREQVHRTPATGRMIFSELVGRARELAQLRQCVGAALAGRGGIVSVVGEAGLGKSRLLAELLAQEELRAATVLEGRSTSIGQNLSFHPFIDLLRRWAGIEDEDADAPALQKLDRSLAALAPDDADELLPFIATLMGLRLTGAPAARVAGIDGEAMEKLIIKSVRELLQHLARQRPVVLVFEDLHWADLSSVNLLESLLRLVAEHRLLFVHVFRPDYQETAERIMRGALANFADRHVEVRVEPLDEHEAAHLVENLLKIPDLPRATRELITKQAEGNPFYIEEVVRSLIDQGAVEHVDGQFRVTAKIESVVIPGTIQEVIMARVDRLDEATRHLLQVASVIGRNFYHRIVADILHRQGEPDEDLTDEIATLKEKQLLLERTARFSITVGAQTVSEELEYIFKHALAQQTIYDSLLLKTRKEFHGLVAQVIEEEFADRLADFYGMLAYHYGRAEHLEKAEDYSFKAGEESMRSAASAEALKYFQEAQRLYTLLHGDGGDPNRRKALEKNIGFALQNTGQLTECIPHLDQALEYLGARVAKNTPAAQVKLLLDVAAMLGFLYVTRGLARGVTATDRDREVFEIVLPRARALGVCDPRRAFIDNIWVIRRLNRVYRSGIDQACNIYAMSAALFCFSGLSFAVSRRFLTMAEATIRRENAIDLFEHRAMEFMHAYLLGDWSDAYLIDDELVDRVLRYGQVWDANTYLDLSCDRLTKQGRFNAARALIARMDETIDTYGYEFARSNRTAQTAFLLLEERKLPEALDVAEDYYASRQEDPLRILALGTRARIELLLGDRERAAQSLSQVDAIIRRTSLIVPFHLSTYAVAQLACEVEALSSAHGPGTATPHAVRARAARSRRRALRIAQKVARHRTETYRLAGCLSYTVGKPQQALEWWARAIREGERLGTKPELARTFFEVGRRLCEGALPSTSLNGYDGPGYIERARTLFADMGLEWDLGELERWAGARRQLPRLAAAHV
jgi:class 3 adenylate cyclase/tetratricopeptide (TPR) repeat protein